jgi:ElaB/YqjD/DUF883 family membrane-anchored ribosome-binding protein
MKPRFKHGEKCHAQNRLASLNFQNSWHQCVGPQTFRPRDSKFKLSFVSIQPKAPMSDFKNATEKMSSLGARLANQVEGLVTETQPACSRVSHVIKGELHELGESGKEALSDAKHQLEQEAKHVRNATQSLIQHDPIRSVFIAAATGASAALLVSWLMRSRPH